MNNVMHRYCSCVLTIVLLLSTLLVPSSAVGIDLELESGIQTETLNELSVQLTINRYFTQRQEYLKGNTDTIADAVTAITTDETSHKALMEQAGISLVRSSVVIDYIECWDYAAAAIATETATFLIGGESVQEIITHTLTISDSSDGTLIVWSDGYEATISNFTSCSFVPSDMQLPAETNAPADNWVPCIVAVAADQFDKEEGEEAGGWTKYGAWYGDIHNDSSFDTAPWCAAFVAWCANQASISTSVIPCYAYAPYHRDFFAARGRYYLSRSQGGSYTPQPGDLFFQWGSAESPNHIGIVYYVSGDYIYVIDGNCDNKVNAHNIPLTDSSLVGFAHPNYTYTSHVYSTTWSSNSTHHWHACYLCGFGEDSKTAHAMQIDNVTGESYCAICSYGRGGVSEMKAECIHSDQ